MAHATTAELASFLGRSLEAAEEGKATVVLDVVSEAIDGYVGARTVASSTKKNVALLSGRRLFELPAGVRQEILGDWQASYAAEGLLSDDERTLLDRAVGGTARPSATSVSIPLGIWEEDS